MVEISNKAKEILEKIKEDNVNYKTIGENGRSAFWLWYGKVKEYIKNLDNSESPFISEQIYEMKYWGLIYYDKTIINNEITVFVTGFKFDPYNFWNWLNHAPLNEKLFTQKFNKQDKSINQERPIQPTNPNGKPILVKRWNKLYIYQNPNTNLYALTNKNWTKYTKFLFTSIDWYTPRKYPYIQQQTNVPIIAVGKTNDNVLWTINNEFECVQVMNETKLHSTIDRIITEVIISYFNDNLLIA